MQAAVGLPSPLLSSSRRGDPPSTGLWGTPTAVYGSPGMKSDTFVKCIVWIQNEWPRCRAKFPYFNVKEIFTPSRPGVGQTLGGVRVGGEAALEQAVEAAAAALPLRGLALLQPAVWRRALVAVEATVAADEAADATHGPEGIGEQRAGRNSGLSQRRNS